ncbi:Phosphoribosylformylglycineamidine cyclo-ligase [Patulibacter medicamentivorans]|uniref:Phosphoribosylformylglycinamidine cyclo-ligase n=1 Tax=Patulibacter medicamentivorans TaxID=1097667 RepID=H0E0Y3_9ACTN|nr:phosphoribosylformylglycinamidine cyclo-ligase [Patulibacter medicamentivorans]EHN12673.1 Phosphoribosylformylglycineamidine cyclo-ligase [Patulibacter medicamentivorans]
MSDAYAASGVDTDQSDAGVGALVGVLKTIETGKPSLSVLASGHYASVLRVAPNLGIAVATDGVGSKLIVAEETGRLGTVGIDCIAMNVNDLICVGAEPIAMLDYLAVQEPDAARLAAIGEGLRAGATDAGIEIPGGELAVLPELLRGHPDPGGFDLCGTAIGTVALDELVTGAAITPGDALIGLPSSGIHSNGYTLARKALQQDGGLALDDRPAELGGASVADALLEPTVIYVRAVVELLQSGLPVRGLSHITGGGLLNLVRLGALDATGAPHPDAADGPRLGFAVEDPLPLPPVMTLIQRLGNVSDAEMWEVFNMGCGFVAVVSEEDVDAAVSILGKRHPGTRRIGTVTDRGGECTAPGGVVLRG